MLNAASSAYRWRFFRAGGFDQVKLETGADMMNLDQLDQKLWVALACPASGLEFDPKTLALIDTDKDGRIRAPELIAAVQWAGSMLKDPDELVRGGEATQAAVQTGVRENGWVEVAAPGLKAGDAVVTVGAYGLPATTKIRLPNSPGDETSATSSKAK